MNIITVFHAKRFKQLWNMEKIFFCRPDVFRREPFLRGFIMKLSAADAICRSETRNARLCAHGHVSHLEIPADFIDSLLHILSIRVAVHENAASAFPAEEVVHRSVQRLALDVPERHIDSSNGGHCYRPAAPVRSTIQVLPDVFALKRISSDETG